MKSAVETLSPTRVKLIVEVPFDEIKGDLDAAYKSIGNQIQVPGFRRGKVPSRIIDQRVGRGAVVQEAVNEALPRLYAAAAENESLKAIGQPEVDITAVPLEDGQDLEFTVETDVRPTVEIPDVTGIELVVDPLLVTDDDVEERIATLRERFGTLVGVDRPVQDGDVVSIDLSAKIDDEEIDSVEGVSYDVGSKEMLEGMDEALAGMSEGEVRTFTSTLLGGEHEGKDAECTVTVLAVKVRELPEADDEFAQLASEFDTMDELRADVREKTEEAKRFQQGIQARDKAMEYLLETLEVPVPEGVVAAEVHHHLEGEGRLDDEEHRAEVDANTRSALKSQFILDALAEKYDVQVGQPELVEFLLMSAQQYGMDPNQFAQLIDGEGQLPAMVGEVARRKALAQLLENAVVKDTSGAVLDFGGPMANLGGGALLAQGGDAVTDEAETEAEADGAEAQADDAEGDSAER